MCFLFNLELLTDQKIILNFMTLKRSLKDEASGLKPKPPGDHVAALSGTSKDYRTGA